MATKVELKRLWGGKGKAGAEHWHKWCALRAWEATGSWDLQSRPTSGDDFSWFPNVGASSSCMGLLIASRSLLPCPFSCLHSKWDVSCLFSKCLSLLLLPVPTPCLCYQPSATSFPHSSHLFKQQNYLAKLFHGLLGTAAWLCHHSGHGTEWWIPVLGTHHLTWVEEGGAGGSAFPCPQEAAAMPAATSTRQKPPGG